MPSGMGYDAEASRAFLAGILADVHVMHDPLEYDGGRRSELFCEYLSFMRSIPYENVSSAVDFCLSGLVRHNKSKGRDVSIIIASCGLDGSSVGKQEVGVMHGVSASYASTIRYRRVIETSETLMRNLLTSVSSQAHSVSERAQEPHAACFS